MFGSTWEPQSILQIVLLFFMLFSNLMDNIHPEGGSNIRFGWYVISFDHTFCTFNSQNTSKNSLFYINTFYSF